MVTVMLERVLQSLLDNKLADVLEWMKEHGYTENPGLARALRKLADSIDVPDDIVDAEWSNVPPPSWNMGDVE